VCLSTPCVTHNHHKRHGAAAYTHGVPETAAQICVRVRLFASYREAAGTRELATPLPVGARVSDLVDLLAARLPSLRTAPGMIAVNHTYVGADFQLHDGDEAAFIPPVSGGN
jgi:molybdopterin converting factor subunit 1